MANRTTNRGTGAALKKLTPADEARLIAARSAGASYEGLSKRFGVSKGIIGKLCKHLKNVVEV